MLNIVCSVTHRNQLSNVILLSIISLFEVDHSIRGIDAPSHNYSIAYEQVGFNLSRLGNSDIAEVGKLNPAEISSTEF